MYIYIHIYIYTSPKSGSKEDEPIANFRCLSHKQKTLRRVYIFRDPIMSKSIIECITYIYTSTRRSTPSTRPHGSGRRCRPPQVARVDAVAPPPHSGRRRRPAHAPGSPPSPRPRSAGRRRRPAHSPRVEAVDRSLPSGRPIRLFQQSARNRCPRAEVSQRLASEGIEKADSGNK